MLKEFHRRSPPNKSRCTLVPVLTGHRFCAFVLIPIHLCQTQIRSSHLMITSVPSRKNNSMRSSDHPEANKNPGIHQKTNISQKYLLGLDHCSNGLTQLLQTFDPKHVSL